MLSSYGRLFYLLVRIRAASLDVKEKKKVCDMKSIVGVIISLLLFAIELFPWLLKEKKSI